MQLLSCYFHHLTASPQHSTAAGPLFVKTYSVFRTPCQGQGRYGVFLYNSNSSRHPLSSQVEPPLQFYNQIIISRSVHSYMISLNTNLLFVVFKVLSVQTSV